MNTENIGKYNNNNKTRKKNRKYERKVMNGNKANIRQAPWSVAVTNIGKDKEYWCSGTLISSRHVLTSTHCFLIANKEKNVYEWKYDMTQLSRELCDNNDVEVPEDMFATIRLNTVCQNSKICEKARKKERFVERSSSKIWLLNVCNDNITNEFSRDDIAIIELDSDVEFTKTVEPACVTSHINDSQLGGKIELYGYGDDPTENSVNRGILKYETCQICECKTMNASDNIDWLCSKSVGYKNQLACTGDSGGGGMTCVDNRTTIIGILSRSPACDINRHSKAVDYYAPVIQYNRKICLYTGVCTSEYIPTLTHSSSIPSILHPFLVLFVVFLLF